MATEALDLSHGIDFSARPHPFAAATHRLQLLLRLARRRHLRRVRLAQVLAATQNRRLIEEAGFHPPGPSILDRWCRTVLEHRH